MIICIKKMEKNSLPSLTTRIFQLLVEYMRKNGKRYKQIRLHSSFNRVFEYKNRVILLDSSTSILKSQTRRVTRKILIFQKTCSSRFRVLTRLDFRVDFEYTRQLVPSLIYIYIYVYMCPLSQQVTMCLIDLGTP